jgi:hypothetical protein
MIRHRSKSGLQLSPSDILTRNGSNFARRPLPSPARIHDGKRRWRICGDLHLPASRGVGQAYLNSPEFQFGILLIALRAGPSARAPICNPLQMHIRRICAVRSLPASHANSQELRAGQPFRPCSFVSPWPSHDLRLVCEWQSEVKA